MTQRTQRNNNEFNRTHSGEHLSPSTTRIEIERGNNTDSNASLRLNTASAARHVQQTECITNFRAVRRHRHGRVRLDINGGLWGNLRCDGNWPARYQLAHCDHSNSHQRGKVVRHQSDRVGSAICKLWLGLLCELFFGAGAHFWYCCVHAHVGSLVDGSATVAAVAAATATARSAESTGNAK